jgi:hypothetical protein
MKANGIAIAIEFRTDLCEQRSFFLADTTPLLQIRGDVPQDEMSPWRYTNRCCCCGLARLFKEALQAMPESFSRSGLLVPFRHLHIC